jgi:eukaryotic-like serine/threonine-protein kinase
MKICPACARRFPDNVLRCPEDESELSDFDPGVSPPTDDLVGRRMFGDYIIDRRLGEGGMGTVYLARHSSIDQCIAIKVLHGHAAESSELLQRFNREARVIAKLTHPNIIRVFIFGHTDDGLVYLAMEYVQGGSVRDLLEARGRLSERHALYILKQVLGAVAEAHDYGIIHRDLKPDNILLTEYRGNAEFVKVVDFGIAKVSEPDGEPEVKLTQAGVVYGTPEYLSPEQAQGKPLDGRSDLYSLGIILWELVTGDVPFLGNTAMSVLVKHVYDPVGDPRAKNPNLSDEMVAILQRALAKNPKDRFQSAAEFLDALKLCELALETSGRGLKQDDNIDTLRTQIWTPPPEFFSDGDMPHPREPPPERRVPELGALPPAPVSAWGPNPGAPNPGASAWTELAPPPPGQDPARRAATVVLVIGIVLLATVAAAILLVILR